MSCENGSLDPFIKGFPWENLPYGWSDKEKGTLRGFILTTRAERITQLHRSEGNKNATKEDQCHENEIIKRILPRNGRKHKQCCQSQGGWERIRNGQEIHNI